VKEQIKSKTKLDAVSTLPLNHMIALLHIDPSSSLVASELSKRLGEMNEYKIATVVNGLRHTRTATPAITRLLDLLSRDITHRLSSSSSFSPRDLALIYNGFAYFGPSKCSLQFFRILGDSVIKHASKFNAVQVPIILHAIAKSETADTRLFGALLTRDFFENQLHNLSPKGVSMILYAIGKCVGIAIAPSDAIRTLSEIVKRKISDFPIQAIAMSSYGFSKVNFFDQELFKIISNEIVYRATIKRNSRSLRYTIADLGMISRAFSGKSGWPEVSFAIMQLAKGKFGYHKNFDISPTPDGLVSIISALSNGMDLTRTRGYERWISDNTYPVIDQLKTSQICTIISSLLRLKIKNRQLLLALGEKIDPKLVPIESIPRTMHLLSRIPVHDEKIETFCKIFSIHMMQYQMDDLVHFLHALSELNYRSNTTLSRIEQAIVNQVDSLSFGGQEILSKLVVASARLRLVDDRFHLALWGTLYGNINKFNTERSITNTLFAIATTVGSGDCVKNEWIPEIVSRLVEKTVDIRLSVEGIRQIQIVNLWLHTDFSVNINLNDRTRNFMKRISQINTFENGSIEQSSESHREISQYLMKLDLNHRNEVVLGPFSLDIYVAETKTVIEVDGPHHFFKNSVLRTSSSVLKHRILSSLGYRVEHVPYHEWLQCTNDAKKLAYCNALANIARTQN